MPARRSGKMLQGGTVLGMSTENRRPTRRTLLGLAAAWPALATAQDEPPKRLVFPGKRPLLVHNDFPECLESPPELLTSWITPNDAFFVRQHLPRPRINTHTYRLEVTGSVSRRMSLSLEELKKLPQHSLGATMECAGNGRGLFRPKLPGLQWTKGAIGNANWRGPRVRDILALAGGSGAAYLSVNGADTGVGQTPDFVRSIPMSKAMHEATIVALEMNGEPLPDLHGHPARLIVPGWDGASWVKFLSRMEAAGKPDEGFYMNPAYRMPRNAVAPGKAAKPEELEVIEGMAVKSFITRPADQAVVALGRLVVMGIAWAGQERVERVEFSADGGSRWQNAELIGADQPFAWRTWQAAWSPSRTGYHTLCCRASDSAGRTQPIEPLWNPSGYLYNAVDRIGLVVGG